KFEEVDMPVSHRSSIGHKQRIMIALALLLVGLLVLTNIQRSSLVSPTRAATTWNLSWSDDFNGAANTQPDSNKWNIEVTNTPYNNELEAYTSSTNNLRMDGNGNLVIEARQ